MCPSVSALICSLNTTVLHHIAVMKCVSGSPRINLDAGLVGDMKLQFPGLLHVHLT
jgi:hypothetical protein